MTATSTSPMPSWGAPAIEGLPAAHDVIERALALSDDQCVVLVEDSHQAEVRFANNTTTTNGIRTDRRVTVIRFVKVDGGIAAGTASRSGNVDVRELLDAATRDARGSAPADDAEPLVLGGVDDAFGDPQAHTDLGVLEEALHDLAGAFDRAERADRILFGFAEHRMDTTFLGTGTGIRRRHVQPTGALHMVARSTDGKRSSWAGRGTADFGDISFEVMEERVAKGLEWARERFDLPAGRYDVVLPPEAVADLMVPLVEAAGLRETEEGRTVFSASADSTSDPRARTRLGERLSTLPFTLWSDPTEAGLTCIPFMATASSGADISMFDNGMGLERVDWIDHGHLRRLRTHRAGAARAGLTFSPPIDNLMLEAESVESGDGTLEDLVADVERGLLLTCLWYIREVDPATLLLTGLTRDGVHVIEDGRVIGAANNFRFNESPVDLLGRVTGVGARTRTLGREFGEWVNRTSMPPLRIPDFNMSSVSPAN